MKCKAKIESAECSPFGKITISFVLYDNIKSLEGLENEPELDLEFKKHREKRSLDANRLCLGIIR